MSTRTGNPIKSRKANARKGRKPRSLVIQNASNGIILLDDEANALDTHVDILENPALRVAELYVLMMEKGTSTPVKVFGKEHEIPRKEMMFALDSGDGRYGYSGRSIPVHTGEQPLVRMVIEWARRAYPGYHWDRALVNLYRDGNDCIGYHGDNEDGLVKGSPVITAIFGAGVRQFLVKCNKTGFVYKIPEKDNMALVMKGPSFQKQYKHSVPRRSNVGGYRLSVTLRSHARTE